VPGRRAEADHEIMLRTPFRAHSRTAQGQMPKGPDRRKGTHRPFPMPSVIVVQSNGSIIVSTIAHHRSFHVLPSLRAASAGTSYDVTIRRLSGYHLNHLVEAIVLSPLTSGQRPPGGGHQHPASELSALSALQGQVELVVPANQTLVHGGLQDPQPGAVAGRPPWLPARRRFRPRPVEVPRLTVPNAV
jgi:hypothetical protein